MEEIMYRLYVLENIRKGQEDAAQGKTKSADKVLSDIKTWRHGQIMPSLSCTNSMIHAG